MIFLLSQLMFDLLANKPPNNIEMDILKVVDLIKLNLIRNILIFVLLFLRSYLQSLGQHLNFSVRNLDQCK